MGSSSSPIIMVSFLIIAILFINPVSAYSDDATHWLNQGNTLIQSKNYTQAIDAFDHAIALEPLYFEAWDRKADALNRAGQFNNASAASSRSLEINPKYVQGWINRGQILYNLGYYYEDQMHNTDKANVYYNEQLTAYENAIQLDPNNAEAWFNKGYALAGMKRYDEAITIFDKVQSLDPNYPNLALSQKQARILRDAAAPAYVKYSLPIIAVFLVIIIVAGYYFYKRKNAEIPEDPEPENRQARRRKER